MNKLVYGGTPQFLSNRAVEKGCELLPVGEDVTEYIVTAIRASYSLTKLIHFLKDMDYADINFVGSKDYVYMTSSMISVIEALQTVPNLTYDHFRLLTRCCGLRGKVMELMGVEYLK